MAPVCEVPRKVWRVRSGTPFEYSTFNFWATRWRQMWRHSFQMLKIWKHWLLNSVANLKAALHIEALYRATMVHTQFRCSKGADIKFCLVNSTTVLKVISVFIPSSLLSSSSPLWSSAASPMRATSTRPKKRRSTASSTATKTPAIMGCLWAPWHFFAVWASWLWTSISLRSAASKTARKLCWLILGCQVNTLSFHTVFLYNTL